MSPPASSPARFKVVPPEMTFLSDHPVDDVADANQNPGEHFTPREVIRLRVDLVHLFDTDPASSESVARTVHDCCCGTGGVLTLTKPSSKKPSPPHRPTAKP